MSANRKSEETHREDEVVGGDADVKGVGLGPALPLERAFPGAAVVGQQLKGGAPLLALHFPVQHHAGRYHHQVGAPHPPAMQEAHHSAYTMPCKSLVGSKFWSEGSESFFC